MHGIDYGFCIIYVHFETDCIFNQLLLIWHKTLNTWHRTLTTDTLYSEFIVFSHQLNSYGILSTEGIALYSIQMLDRTKTPLMTLPW